MPIGEESIDATLGEGGDEQRQVLVEVLVVELVTRATATPAG